MAARWIELATGSLEQKKQYRQYKARIEALPEPYGTSRRLCSGTSWTSGASRTARPPSRCSTTSPICASGRGRRHPVRAIVGDDPVEFAETFAQTYTGKQWIDKERARLTKAIDDAERGEQE